MYAKSSLRTDLYPPIEPHKTGWMEVDEIHSVYWEESGNPQGMPVVFLHGGPGAGASPTHRRFFDPTAYRIVIFDQRGAGRSTPLGEVRNNTTEALVEDIERLRQFLDIERWCVFGGSWGSTLALAYAQTHPDRVMALVLRGIFLMQDAEIDWFLGNMGRVFPEAYESFCSIIPEQERSDLLGAYWARLNSDDPSEALAAARSWSLYEGSCSTLLPNPELTAAAGGDTHALGLARLEAHFFINNRFDPRDKLLKDMHRIRHIPAVIVQGRYDMVCPVVSANTLHRAWPEADYIVIPDAGHSAMEPGIRSALVQATERFKGRLTP